MNRRDLAKALSLGAAGAAGATLVSSPALAQGAAGSRLQQSLARGTIRVGTTGDFNPMSFRDPQANELRGFDVEAMQALATDLGIRVEWVTTDWATLIAGIAANRYDIFAGGASVNVARARAAGFTIPYTEAGTVPLSLKANAGRFGTWEAINAPGVRVAVILGTVFNDQARAHFPRATITAVAAPATGFQEVLAGRADVVVTSNVEASSLIQRFDQLAIVAPGSEMRNRRPFGYVLPQDDLVWKNFLDTWVTLKKTEGFFAGLEQKWLPRG